MGAFSCLCDLLFIDFKKPLLERPDMESTLVDMITRGDTNSLAKQLSWRALNELPDLQKIFKVLAEYRDTHPDARIRRAMMMHVWMAIQRKMPYNGKLWGWKKNSVPAYLQFLRCVVDNGPLDCQLYEVAEIPDDAIMMDAYTALRASSREMVEAINQVAIKMTLTSKDYLLFCQWRNAVARINA